jgi:SAM-dependent methyltransferase
MGISPLAGDWYRSTLSGDPDALFWEDGAAEKVELVLSMLQPRGDERVLDLACTTGQRTLELARRGFSVVGTEIDAELLEVGGCQAEIEDLYPLFQLSDPRELEFLREFDLVLSVGGGAFGYFDDERGDRVALQRASQALRPGGRLLMQTPNLRFVEAFLPRRTWLESEDTTLLIEQRWSPETRCLEASMMVLIDGEAFEDAKRTPFRRRIYSVEQLGVLFEAVGMGLTGVYDEEGRRCAPSEIDQQIFVEARF